MKVGVVGLGKMGAAIAANLIASGHEVTVWNRTASKSDALGAKGARPASSPRAAAGGDVVITMLADDKAVEQVVFGADGILAAPAVHMSMSTISVALSERLLSEQGHDRYLSAPVFGRPAAAEAAKLFVVAAGDAGLIEKARPLFEAISQGQFVIGNHAPAANVVKLCGNFMIMSAVEAMGEAMTLASRAGVEPAKLLEVLTGTLFSAPVYKTYGNILVERTFSPPGFAAPLGLKDMNLAAAAAETSGTAMPLLDLVRSHLRTLIDREGGDVDWSAIVKVIEGSAGQ